MSAITYADRVLETTTDTGTGTINLAGAVTCHRTFVAGIGDGNHCIYCIDEYQHGGSDWEIGIGTVTDASPDTLSRDHVLYSSNSNALVNFSAGTKDVFCARNAGGAGDGAGDYGQNFLMNASFPLWERTTDDGASAATMNDDTYDAPDRWYSLLQGSGATIQRVSAEHAQYAARLNSGGTTNRFGIAQIVESHQAMPMRGREITFQCGAYANKNAGSGTIVIRAALLAWTGSADSVTSDVVNDWTSGTFTTGNFFNSTSLSLIATDSVTVAHNTDDLIILHGTVPTGATNLIVMVWTEDVPAHASDYIRIEGCDLFPGRGARHWTERPVAEERLLCGRYYEAKRGILAANTAWTGEVTAWDWSSRKRTTPSLTTSNIGSGSGAAFSALDDHSFYQTASNSTPSSCDVEGDAEL